MHRNRHNRPATVAELTARARGPLARAAVGKMRVKELHIEHLVVDELEVRNRAGGVPG